MAKLLLKFIFIGFAVTIGLVLVGASISAFPAYMPLIIFCFLSLVLTVFFLAYRGSYRQTELSVKKWAEEKGYQITSLGICSIGMQFGRAIFSIEVIDSQGKKKKGFGNCQNIFSSKNVTVKWSD